MTVAVGVLLVAWNNLANVTAVFRRRYVTLNLFLAAALVAVGLAADRTWADLGLVGGRLGPGLAAGAGAAAVTGVVLAAGVAWTPVRGRLADERVRGLSPAEVRRRALLRIPVGTALVEEIAFRGVLLALAGGAGVGPVAVSSGVFGLWHVVPTWQAAVANGAGRRSAAGAAVGGVVVTAMAGAGLCWLRLATDSLLGPVLVHAAVNVGGLLAAVAAHRRGGA